MPILILSSSYSLCWRNPPVNIRPSSSIIQLRWVLCMAARVRERRPTIVNANHDTQWELQTIDVKCSINVIHETAHKLLSHFNCSGLIQDRSLMTWPVLSPPSSNICSTRQRTWISSAGVCTLALAASSWHLLPLFFASYIIVSC